MYEIFFKIYNIGYGNLTGKYIIKYVRLKWILNTAMPQRTSKGCMVLPSAQENQVVRGLPGWVYHPGASKDRDLTPLWAICSSVWLVLLWNFFPDLIGISHIAACPLCFSYLQWLLPRRFWLYLLCLCPALRQLKSTVRFYLVSS